MRPDWDGITEAVEALRKKPALHRIDGLHQSNDCHFKVYRVAGGIIRVDIKPKEVGRDEEN